MSVFEVTNKLEQVTKVHYRKRYNPNDVVALCYINNKEVKYHFKDYNVRKLKDLVQSPMYSEVHVHPDFWDPMFCSRDNISIRDSEDTMKRLGVEVVDDIRGLTIGFILATIGILTTFITSYSMYNHVSDIPFDKNIIRKILNTVDIVFDMNPIIIDIIKSAYGNDIVTSFTTPQGMMRYSLRDMGDICKDIEYHHEISSIIVKTIPNEIEILTYHLELLKACKDNIQSPKVINSYSVRNILLHLLIMDLNLDYHEKRFMTVINAYIEKGGSVDIKFEIIHDKPELQERLFTRLDLIKEYR